MDKIHSSEITPERMYLSRRRFLVGAGGLAGALALAACTPAINSTGQPVPTGGQAAPTPNQSLVVQPTAGNSAPRATGSGDETGSPLNTYQEITTYNNYYEFSQDKESPAALAKNLRVRPWTLQVGGLVSKPKTYDVDELTRRFAPEERIYRLRCVEAWSMVIPWLGFSLNKLLNEVEPLSSARYVRFEGLHDPGQFPGQRSNSFQWPYIEGLRVDEAMSDLALMATGLYGKALLPQNGAPLRLVAPWKYGFKSIKAIVKLDLVADQPKSLWMAAAPGEYGFFANVNPAVPHPRWSQASERRIGTLKRMETLPFNGYAEQVASLYAGMDLKKNY